MNSRLLPIFLIVVVDVLGLTLVIPLLPFYAEHYGASPFVVGCLVASYAVCQLIASPILGHLSDRFGRRPLLLFSQVGTFIGFLILAFANSLPLIFLGRIIDGLTAGNLSIAAAYISDVTEPQNRAKAFGMIGIAFGMGFLFGPAISGYLSQFGYHYPILAAAALSATSIAATYVLLPVTQPEPGARPSRLLETAQYLRYFRDPKLSPLLCQFACFAVAFSLFISGFPLFAERRYTAAGVPFGPREVGYTYAYSGAIGVVIQGFMIGPLVTRFGERGLTLAGFLLTTVGHVILAYSFGIPGLIAAATLSSLGNSVLRPSITSLISQNASRSEQGLVLGITQSINSISQIVAPLTAGLFIEYGRLNEWCLSMAFVTGMGLLLIIRGGRYKAKA